MSDEEIQKELDYTHSVIVKLSNILHRTANAIHGGPLENGLWSFHDLPDLIINHFDKLVEAIKSYDKYDGNPAKGGLLLRNAIVEILPPDIQKRIND